MAGTAVTVTGSADVMTVIVVMPLFPGLLRSGAVVFDIDKTVTGSAVTVTVTGVV